MRTLALLSIAAVVASGAAGADAAAPRRGGTVVIADPSLLPEPSCLGPAASCFGRNLGPVANQVLEGAFEIAADFTYRPNLVSRVTIGTEPFTLTYHIRPEARWSDGVPVTASDFLFTWKAIVARTVEWGPGLPPEFYEKIRRLQVVNAKTARLTFREPFAPWRELFRWVLPRHALEGFQLVRVWRNGIVNLKTGRAIGSGPFLVGSWERGRQLTLVRNRRYWRPGRPLVDRIVIRYLRTDAERVAALRAGDVDVTRVGFEPGVEAIVRDPRFRSQVVPGLAYEHLAIRSGPGRHRALANPLVRRAIAYSIDREALVRRLFAGLVRSPKPLQNLIFLSNSPFYEPHWSSYRYRPAEARRLLGRAGCRRGPDGVYVCGGARLSLRFGTTAANPRRKLVADVVQDQLARVGIEIEPHFFGSVDQLLRSELDLLLFAWILEPDPWGPADVWRCAGAANLYGYCNRVVSRQLLRSAEVVDPRRRAALLNRVDAAFARDVPALPLYQIPFVLLSRRSVQGLVENPTTEDFTWNSEEWWLARG